MSRPGDRLRRWCALGVALLCLVVWLDTALHLALEPHDHDFVRLAVEHDDDHHHDDHGHPDGESHDADDHLIPATSRPETGSADLLALPPHTRVTWESCSTTPPPAPPRDEVEPKTDPPPASRRPRAPPVG